MQTVIVVVETIDKTYYYCVCIFYPLFLKTANKNRRSFN